jgi:hypothetical protein
MPSPFGTEAGMNQTDLFVHHANIEMFRKQLADTTDQTRRHILLELLASEEDRGKPLSDKIA